MTAPIVVTGATGNTGSVLAEKLAQRGVPFVAMARSERNRNALRARGIDVVAGDFDDEPGMERALRGAEKAYLVCTPDERMTARETAFLRAAKRAGVKHVVKCSAYRAEAGSASHTLRAHAAVERGLEASGLEWTVLRPHGFMQTLTLFSWDLIREVGVVSAPHGDGKMPVVDVRDVAEAAARVLTEPGHAGKRYDLTGPEALSMWDLAETLERVLGRPVSYLEGDARTMSVALRVLGVTANSRQHVEAIARMVRSRELETVHGDLRALGVEPTTYERFVRDLVAGRTGGGNSYEPPNGRAARVLGRALPLVMRAQIALRGRPARPAG